MGIQVAATHRQHERRVGIAEPLAFHWSVHTAPMKCGCCSASSRQSGVSLIFFPCDIFGFQLLTVTLIKYQQLYTFHNSLNVSVWKINHTQSANHCRSTYAGLGNLSGKKLQHRELLVTHRVSFCTTCSFSVILDQTGVSSCCFFFTCFEMEIWCCFSFLVVSFPPDI